MPTFKVDENLPTEAAELLRIAGHDAVTVGDQRMAGQPDTNVALVCQREGRAVVTLDLDFADIRAYPPGDYSGIIVLRLARLDKPRVLWIVQRLLPLLEHEPLVGKLWIVDEASVRVRD
jgi:predicted nuclease of predicted toxin-antitoxin system